MESGIMCYPSYKSLLDSDVSLCLCELVIMALMPFENLSNPLTHLATLIVHIYLCHHTWWHKHSCPSRHDLPKTSRI